MEKGSNKQTVQYYYRNRSLLKHGVLKYIKLFEDEKKRERKGTEGQKEISLYSYILRRKV